MNDRHQFRAQWHDYNKGTYFVTICCADKQHYFGRITSDSPVGTRFIASEQRSILSEQRSIASKQRFIPSALGRLVEKEILNIPSYYNDVEIWNHVVMPNHIHLIISVGTRFITSTNETNKTNESPNTGCLKPREHNAPESQDFHHNSRLASIVGAFKAGVTRQWRQVGTRFIASEQRTTASTPANTKIWQPRFHEHIIRNQRAYDYIMNYIDNNIENWCYDRFNANRIEMPGSNTTIVESSADAKNRCSDAKNRVPTNTDTTINNTLNDTTISNNEA